MAEKPKAEKPAFTPFAPVTLAGKKQSPLQSQFQEIRNTLLENHDAAARLPRPLKLALEAVDMAERAAERHIRHTG